MFRNFLYLDNKILHDYLSTVEGVVVTEKEIKTIESKSKKGGAHIAGVGGDLSNESSEEVVEKVLLNDAAKFNKLYEYMEENNHLQSLTAFDEKIWNQIKRKEIIEADVMMNVPKLFKQFNAAGDLLPMIGAIQNATGEIFDGDEDDKIFKALQGMKETMNTDLIPLICESELTEGYKFILQLKSEYLQVDIKELNEEATIIGKVQKIYNEEEEVEFFSLLPSMKGLLNREERRKLNKSGSKDSLIEFVKGPVMKIIPLAIFR
jgi:hypothetical protein